jgi:hypothetical protein
VRLCEHYRTQADGYNMGRKYFLKADSDEVCAQVCALEFDNRSFEAPGII